MHSVTHLIVNKLPHSLTHLPLTLSRPRFLSYRNQSIDLESKLRATGFYMIGISVMKEFFFFFSIGGFFHDHSRFTGLQGKEEGISLTPHYYFYPLHRYCCVLLILRVGACVYCCEKNPYKVLPTM